METDFYSMLGVERSADADEIRAAYKRLVRTTHPDVGGNAALFILVQQAYDTLGDPLHRAEYDRSCAGSTTEESGDSVAGFPDWEEVDAEVVDEPHRWRRPGRPPAPSRALPLPVVVLLGALVVGITGWLASGPDHWLAWQVDQGIPHAIGLFHGPVPAFPAPKLGAIFWSVIGGGVGAVISERVVRQLRSRRRVHTIELGILAIYALWQTVLAAAAWVLVVGVIVLIIRFGGLSPKKLAHDHVEAKGG